ncbi:MAG: hypothetical protein L3I99_06985 [Sulfurimonas sp.]|nr:hypothetical protein [Sulfurimonas sp.]
MLNKQQQFLRHTLEESITQYEEYIDALGFFDFFKKSEYNSLIVMFKNLIPKLNDNENILENMTMGEVATLRNVSLEIIDKIKSTPNYLKDENLIAEITLAIECVRELSKELSEADDAKKSKMPSLF